VAAITVLAAVLRLLALSKVSPDPFYDAAVRSMSLSFHNFFFGAFEPGGSVSIDKPPVDLWLQVASVKLFGFSSTTLKLPEAFAGIAAVPLLYMAVRRMWSAAAGVAAALALAVLPVEVITARSDTMDGVMMLLLVVALLLLVRAAETGSTVWLLGAAAALGVAFNVKLLESFVALPGLALFAYLGLPGPRRRRVLQLGVAGVVYVAVALSWLTATLIAPASERPYAIGSTNGSAWNAAFVFNGTDRLGSKSPEPQFTVYVPGHHYAQATQSERDRIPIVPPSATRLLARIGPLSGERLGLELLVALLLGVPALVWGVLRGRGSGREDQAAANGGAPRARSTEPEPEPEPGPGPGPTSASGSAQARARWGNGALAADGEDGVGARDQPEPEPEPAGARAGAATATLARAGARGTRRAAGEQAVAVSDSGGEAAARMRRATAGGIGLWTLSGIVLFSDMARLHPRYVEGFTPAVAALLGIGLAWACSPGGRLRLALLGASMLITVYYAERLLYGRPGTWWIALLGALATVALAALARSPYASRALRTLLPAGVLAAALVAVLAIPMSADVTAIETHVTDAGYVGALPAEEQSLISSYLRAHQHGARYEVAAESATAIGSLIVQDARPILVLSTYNGRVFTTVAQLKRLIAQGAVRYAFLNTTCGANGDAQNPACSAPARWVRAHATDVSHEAGLRGKTLWLLPGVKA